MPTTIEDFTKTATKEQKNLLLQLLEVHEKQEKLLQIYNKKVEPYEKDARETSELKDGQMAHVIREDAHDMALRVTYQERKELEEIKEQKKELLIKATEKYGMGHLGLIQREYKRYFRKSLPAKLIKN
jgi:hypothetical protein